MKLFIRIVWLVIMSFTLVFSQIQFSKNELNVTNAQTGSDYVTEIFIKNSGTQPEHIKSLRNADSSFHYTMNNPDINPNDSSKIIIRINQKHNIQVTDFLSVESNSGEYAFIKISASFSYGDEYDSYTFDKWDEDLKSALKTFTSTGYFNLGYNTARDYMFSQVDNVNDHVYCVYTGDEIFVDHNSSTPRTDAYNAGFNTEHTYVQSAFNKDEPMRADLHHLFPTRIDVNGARGSLKFAEIDDSQVDEWFWHNTSTTTIPSQNIDEYSELQKNIAFEPREDHKGDVARAMFYFVVRYQNYDNFFTGQEVTFRGWNSIDPVSQKEIDRNNAIATLQHNRNPFVDHPELVERIINFTSSENRSWDARVFIVEDSLFYSNSNQTTFIHFANFGKGNLNISSIESTDSDWEIQGYPSSLAPTEMGTINLHYSGLNFGNKGKVIIHSNDPINGNIEIVLYPESVTKIVHTEKNRIMGLIVKPNYPNPFNPKTRLQVVSNANQQAQLIVFNSLGQMVLNRLIQLTVGENTITVDGSYWSSGLYYYQVRAGERRAAGKMVLLK